MELPAIVELSLVDGESLECNDCGKHIERDSESGQTMYLRIEEARGPIAKVVVTALFCGPCHTARVEKEKQIPQPDVPDMD